MVDVFVFVGSTRGLEQQYLQNSDWFSWYHYWSDNCFDNLQTGGQMAQYSPIIFKNPDKRTDLPNPLQEEFDKDNSPFDLEAIQKLRELHRDE